MRYSNQLSGLFGAREFFKDYMKGCVYMKNFIKNIKRTEAKEYIRKSTLMVGKGQLKTAVLWTIGAAAVFTIVTGFCDDKTLKEANELIK